jgi:glucose-1-phosphate adenylyltransferase
MFKKECVAMILAGGQGSRLGVLTKKMAKPAVPFGGKYRIIDFALSNCTNSGIDTVGVLTQYHPLVLNRAIGIGSSWDLDRKFGGVSVLPPYMREQGGEWYKGTANAVYQNIDFIQQSAPKYVLVLSGDHIYKMDYGAMLAYHRQKNAEVTIAVIQVPWEEANRFGVLETDEQEKITVFAEKPRQPKSNLASMGIYIFNWERLKRCLREDEEDPASSNDFGKNVIPALLSKGSRMFAYKFDGYWKDVGTTESFWEANMDLLADEPALSLHDPGWKIYAVLEDLPPQYLGPKAKVNRALINEGCQIYGEVSHSVVFPGVVIGENSVVKDSIIMPHVKIGSGVRVEKAIIGQGAAIGNGCQIGVVGVAEEGENTQGVRGMEGDITVIEEKKIVKANTVIYRWKEIVA